MARILRRIKASARRKLLNDASDVSPSQSALLNLPMPMDRTEQRPIKNACLLDPFLKRANRARVWGRSIRYADLASDAVLIGLGSAQCDCEPVLAKHAILDVQAHQLRTAECACEPEQY